MRKYCVNDKITEEFSNYRVYCKNCGHSMLFYPMEKREKKICSWCQNTVYINDIAEFKDKLNKQRGKLAK